MAERSLGWINRFLRQARDYERLPKTLTGLHFVVFAILMLLGAAGLSQNPGTRVSGDAKVQTVYAGGVIPLIFDIARADNLRAFFGIFTIFFV